MPLRRLLLLPALVALVAGLGAPAAGAQSIPSPEELAPLTEQPQVPEPPPAEEPPAQEPLPAEEPPAQEPAPAEEPAPRPSQAGSLPDTGSDARIEALLGATVLLAGLGLRLRTAPEHF